MLSTFIRPKILGKAGTQGFAMNSLCGGSWLWAFVAESFSVSRFAT
jgi:hypothetical protein